MLTVPQLTAWTDAAWTPAYTMMSRREQVEKQTAKELSEQATAIRSKWTGLVGKTIATLIEGLAKSHLEWLPILNDIRTILQHVTGELTDRQHELRGLLATAAYQRYVVDDPGYCNLPPGLPAFKTMADIIQRMELLVAAQRLTNAIRTKLLDASGDDELAAISLARLADTTLPSLIDGPLDLTDAGIRMQTLTNSQDEYGSCVTLASLMGIGLANPDFIRRHVTWDPSTGQYTITLYDPHTREPIQVGVRPSEIESKASDLGGTDLPTYLSVYEAALEKQFGEDYTEAQSLGNALPVITGKRPHPVAVDQIGHTINHQPPGTVIADNMNQPPGTDPVKLLCPGHAYTVTGVDAAGNITLTNPWGPQGGFSNGDTYYPGSVSLTSDEYSLWVGRTIALDQPY